MTSDRAPSSSFCLTCSSEVIPSQPSSSNASSSSIWLTPCCSTPICSTCLDRNPRLRDYVPCLRCGDVRTSTGVEAIRKGKESVLKDRAKTEELFSIGDDDDEDDDHQDRDREDETRERDELANERQSRDGRSPPPGYSMLDNGQGSGPSSRAQSIGRKSIDTRSDGTTSHVIEKEELEVVEVKHPVSRGDTILSIARKYAADPHELLELNSLPSSVLTSQPHLLRTRRTLIISRRLVHRSKLPNPTLFESDSPLDDLDNLKDSLPVDEEAERKREMDRAIKRFQLMTKEVDKGVAGAYLGLSELEEEDALFEGVEEYDEPPRPLDLAQKTKETARTDEEVQEGDSQVAEVGKTDRVRGKKVMRDPANREDRALEAFFDDEDWQADVGEPERGKGMGKWKTVGNGANMGIKV